MISSAAAAAAGAAPRKCILDEIGALDRAVEPDIQDGAGKRNTPLLRLEIDEIKTVGPVAGDFQVRVQISSEIGQCRGRRTRVRLRDNQAGERRSVGHSVFGQGSKDPAAER